MVWSRVVLPQPDPPTIPVTLPAGGVKSRDWRTRRPSYSLDTLASRIIRGPSAGAEVHAIEEVVKYAECARRIADYFEVDRLEVESRSLYSLDEEKYQDAFDTVLYSGVLYHVTDPVVSLRLLYNTLRDGGRILVETAISHLDGSVCEYQGAGHTFRKDRGEAPRGGWNWFFPTTEALAAMMADVGFEVQSMTVHGGRALAVGVRGEHQDMLRAGLARPDLR